MKKEQEMEEEVGAKQKDKEEFHQGEQEDWRIGDGKDRRLEAWTG